MEFHSNPFSEAHKRVPIQPEVAVRCRIVKVFPTIKHINVAQDIRMVVIAFIRMHALSFRRIEWLPQMNFSPYTLYNNHRLFTHLNMQILLFYTTWILYFYLTILQDGTNNILRDYRTLLSETIANGNKQHPTETNWKPKWNKFSL